MATIVDRDTVFEYPRESIKADEKGRVMLGREFSGKRFRISRSPTGEPLLTALVVIPERDMWLYQNPEALAAFHQGLANAAAGRVTEATDFSRYADDVIEDE